MKLPRPCKKCGTVFDTRACKACKRERKAKWYAENREKALAMDKAYREANPEKQKARAAAYRLAHLEERKAYYLKNAEKFKAARLEYYSKNTEKVKAMRAEYAAKNREIIRVYEQNRIAREKAIGGKLSSGIADRLLKLQKGKCACCGQPLNGDFHLDHIMPIALGGSNTDENIQLLKARCNMQKNAKHPIVFMQERGFLL